MSDTEIKAVLTVEGLKKFQSDMNAAADAVEDTGDRGAQAGGKLARHAKVGFLAAGAAAVASVKKFASFDDAMNRVQINSQANSKQMAAMEKAARKMGEQFPASATEVAEAMNEILKAGMSVEDMLGGGLEQALSMATAEGMNMAEAASVMSNAMAAYTISGKGSAEVTAALSNIASATTANISDLATSLGYVGSQASGLGITIGDTSAALGVLIQNGLDGSKAGTSLNAMLTSLADPASKASKAFNDLGIETYDAQGNFRDFDSIIADLSKAMNGMNMREQSELFQTFGRVGAQAARLLSKNKPLFDDLAKSATDMDAPVKKARDQMKSLAMQLDTTGESLGNMAMQVGAALAPAVSAVLPMVQGAAEAIGSLDPALLQAGAAFVALTGAFYLATPAIVATTTAVRAFAGAIAVQAALSGATGGMALFAGATGAATISVRALGAAMLANPLFMAATAAASVVAVASALRMIPGSGADLALQRQKQASDTLSSSLSVLKGAVDGVVSAQLALSGSALGVERAQLTWAQAAARVKQLEKDGKKGTDEWKSAVLSQKEAWQSLLVAKEQVAAADSNLKNEQKKLAKESQAVADAITSSSKTFSESKKELSKYGDVSAAVIDGQRKTVAELMKTDDGLRILAESSSTAGSKIGKIAKAMLEAKSAMSDATSKASSIEGALGRLGGKAGSATDEIAAMRAALNSLPSSKTVTVTVKKKGEKLAGGGIVGGYASGGRVYGPGTGTSDSVPAMLSAGEWVLTAAQAKAIGYGTLASLPKFAKGGTWFSSQATAARASMQSGSGYWKAMEYAGTTDRLTDDRAAMNKQIAALKKRLAAINGQSPSGKGDTRKQNADAKSAAAREVKDMIRELQASVWQINKIQIPQARKASAAEAATAAKQAAVASIGAAGSDIWKRQQLAGATADPYDDLAALESKLASLNALNTPEEAAAEIAQTEADIWTMLNVTIPQHQAAMVQAAIGAVGSKGSDLWKRQSMAAVTDTLDDDLQVLQEQLAELQGFGAAAADRIRDTEADIWTMLNITMPAKARQEAEAAKQLADQRDAWAREADMAMSREFYSASGGAGGGGGVGEIDSTGGGASGVGYAPRPEIDRIWIAGQQLNDLDARDGAGVVITEILGWDEAEDMETTRSKRADGDDIGGQRDGGARVVIRGRVTGSTYQDYHARRRALKAKIRRAAGDADVLMKVPDVTHGTAAGDYPSAYTADDMAGMERREVRLVGNITWGDSFAAFGSEFEIELRSPTRWVQRDEREGAPPSVNGDFAQYMMGLNPAAHYRMGALPDDFVNEYEAYSSSLGRTAAWRLNGGGVDATGGGRTIALTGGPTLAPGALLGDVDGALQFNGTSQRGEVAYHASLNQATFSIDGWVWRDSVNGLHAHIADTRSSSNVGWGVRVSDTNVLLVVVGTGAAQISASMANFPIGRWVHVAATYDGTNARLYMDGVLQSTSSGGTMSANTTAPLRVGVSPVYIGSTQYWNGKLDELTYRGGVVLTAAQIRDLYVKGRPIIDAMGNADAGMIGTLTPAPGLITGDPDTALTGWSTSNYIQRPYDAALNPATFTVGEIIQYGGATGSKHVIKTTRKASTHGYELSITSAGYAQFATYDGSERAVTGSVNLFDGEKHTIFGTWDGTTRRLYVDGVQVASSTTGGYTPNDAAPLRIGIDHTGANPFPSTGIIDEAAVWDAALTADEILSAYQSSWPDGSPNAMASDATNASREVLAITGEVPAAPARDAGVKWIGEDQESVIEVQAGTSSNPAVAAAKTLGTLTLSPPSVYANLGESLMPVGSADGFAAGTELSKQDTFRIDTVSGTATPIHRTPLARLIGGPSFIRAMVPARAGGGSVDVSHGVGATPDLSAMPDAADMLTTGIINEGAGASTVAGELGATLGQATSGLPAWTPKVSGSNLGAGWHLQRQIADSGGMIGGMPNPFVAPVMHVVPMAQLVSWASIDTMLGSLSAGSGRAAHALTLAWEYRAGKMMTIGVGFHKDGTYGLKPAVMMTQDDSPSGFCAEYTVGASALPVTPSESSHRWVFVIIDAGNRVWGACVLIDAGSGTPLYWIARGRSVALDDSSGASVWSGSAANISPTGNSIDSPMSIPQGDRFIGHGVPASWVGSGTAPSTMGAIAGTSSDAGQGPTITLDALSELAPYGVTASGRTGGLFADNSYFQVARAIAQWAGDRFKPQAIERPPIAMDVDWGASRPEVAHGQSIVRLQSRVAEQWQQDLGKSATGGISTAQAAASGSYGVGVEPIKMREVR